MPTKSSLGERLQAFSVLVIMACGLMILAVALFNLDQGEYQLLAVLGLNSVLLGYMVLRQRLEVIRMRQAQDMSDPAKLLELFDKAKAMYEEAQQTQEAH